MGRSDKIKQVQHLTLPHTRPVSHMTPDWLSGCVLISDWLIVGRFSLSEKCGIAGAERERMRTLSLQLATHHLISRYKQDSKLF